jgi:hypothetical protein
MATVLLLQKIMIRRSQKLRRKRLGAVSEKVNRFTSTSSLSLRSFLLTC